MEISLTPKFNKSLFTQVLFKLYLILLRGEGRGVLPETLGGGVRPTSQNLYPIYDQNLRFSLPYPIYDQTKNLIPY